jgi:hypothetical protein
MSRGRRRTDRPIETAWIAPDAIRCRTVRTDTLRIAAVSPTVRSGMGGVACRGRSFAGGESFLDSRTKR